MLKLLRKKERTKKMIFWILIGVSVFAFVLWGSGASRQGPKTTGSAGEIFGRQVPMRDFLSAYSSCMNNVRLRYGDNYNKILPYINIHSEAWTQLILIEEVKRLKITVPNEEVIKVITVNPLFFREGKFNQDTYERITQYFLKVQPREFEEQTRTTLAIGKLYEQITKDTAVIEEEVLAAYKKDFQEVSVNFLLLKPADFAKQIQIKDEELNDYYLKNSEKFKRPPSVKIEYIGIDYPSNAKDKDKNTILDQMNSLSKEIAPSENFKSLAKEPLIYAETDFFTEDQPVSFPAEIRDYAFNLKEKQTSPVIQAEKGAYILRLVQEKEAYIPEFPEVKDKAKDLLTIRKVEDEAKKKIEEYKAKINAYLSKNPGSGLKKVGTDLGMEIKTSEMFKRGAYIPDIGMDKAFSEVAFALKPKEISPALITPSGCFIIEQEKFQDIDQEKFQKEKETYAKSLLERKKQDSFNKFTEELIKKANLKDYTSDLNFGE